MTELVCELIVSLDGFARGRRSPAYYGYFGPDVADWIKTNTAVPHRMLIGRRTYEMLNGLHDPNVGFGDRPCVADPRGTTRRRELCRGEVMTISRLVLEPFVRQQTVLLTTYRRDGTPVGTPVSIAVDGNRAFIRTWDTTGKFKRIRNNPTVEIAPSTFRGTPTGPALRAHARVLSGDESAYAGQLLARKHPILQGMLVPLIHRLRGNRTMHIELTPTDS